MTDKQAVCRQAHVMEQLDTDTRHAHEADAGADDVGIVADLVVSADTERKADKRIHPPSLSEIVSAGDGACQRSVGLRQGHFAVVEVSSGGIQLQQEAAIPRRIRDVIATFDAEGEARAVTILMIPSEGHGEADFRFAFEVLHRQRLCAIHAHLAYSQYDN